MQPFTLRFIEVRDWNAIKRLHGNVSLAFMRGNKCIRQWRIENGRQNNLVVLRRFGPRRDVCLIASDALLVRKAEILQCPLDLADLLNITLVCSRAAPMH